MESRVLIEPWITEAATAAGELGKYIFKVEKKSNKIQIKKAIED
jgi:ribosomal protein L23